MQEPDSILLHDFSRNRIPIIHLNKSQIANMLDRKHKIFDPDCSLHAVVVHSNCPVHSKHSNSSSLSFKKVINNIEKTTVKLQGTLSFPLNISNSLKLSSALHYIPRQQLPAHRVSEMHPKDDSAEMEQSQ